MAQRKAALGTRWASATDVTDRLRQARENREAQRKLLGSLEDRALRRREEMERSLSDLPASQRNPIIGKAVAGFRGELKRETTVARNATIKAAANHRDDVGAIRPHYQSPVQMLMRHSLGSERRSRLLHQIETSGPTEMASLAELAAATKDFELAAALCSRNAALKTADRPFSAHELADVLMGDEHRRVTGALMEIERLTEEAMQENAAFETGRRNPVGTVKVALMKQAETEFDADLSDPEEQQP